MTRLMIQRTTRSAMLTLLDDAGSVAGAIGGRDARPWFGGGRPTAGTCALTTVFTPPTVVTTNLHAFVSASQTYPSAHIRTHAPVDGSRYRPGPQSSASAYSGARTLSTRRRAGARTRNSVTAPRTFSKGLSGSGRALTSRPSREAEVQTADRRPREHPRRPVRTLETPKVGR